MHKWIIVKISFRVGSIKRRHPLLIKHDDHVPQTPQAVNVDNDHKDELEEFQGVFRVLFYIHSLNDASQARDSNQLEQLEKLEKLGGSLRENHREVVKRHSRENINGETALEVNSCGTFWIKNLITGFNIVKSGPKCDNDITTEHQVDESVQNEKD